MNNLCPLILIRFCPTTSKWHKVARDYLLNITLWECEGYKMKQVGAKISSNKIKKWFLISYTYIIPCQQKFNPHPYSCVIISLTLNRIYGLKICTYLGNISMFVNITYLSMTTGSEGVSLRLPHDFFSQHRLKSKTEINDKTTSKKSLQNY